jgi:DNA-binding GntR family transcriptional regulator
MYGNSERHGIYVARWKDSQMNSGFDARLVLEQRGASDV